MWEFRTSYHSFRMHWICIRINQTFLSVGIETVLWTEHFNCWYNLLTLLWWVFPGVLLIKDQGQTFWSALWEKVTSQPDRPDHWPSPTNSAPLSRGIIGGEVRMPDLYRRRSTVRRIALEVNVRENKGKVNSESLHQCTSMWQRAAVEWLICFRTTNNLKCLFQ